MAATDCPFIGSVSEAILDIAGLFVLYITSGHFRSMQYGIKNNAEANCYLIVAEKYTNWKLEKVLWNNSVCYLSYKFPNCSNMPVHLAML